MKWSFITLIVTVLLLTACGEEQTLSDAMDPATLVADLQERLINAKDGEEILLPEGKFDFKRELSLADLSNITIRGKGKGKTVLSFQGQIEGAQGMLVKNVKKMAKMMKMTKMNKF